MQNPRFQYALLPELLVAGGYNKAQVKQVQIDRLRWVHLMAEGEDMNIPPDRNKIFQAIEENPVAYNPTVIETTARGERSFDIFSRLLRERIIFLGQGIDDVVASIIVAQLLLLEGEDPEKDIRLYINCPGGSITSGLAVYDTMMHIRSDVSTICMGQAAAMGAFILSSGAKGKRLALPHSRVLMRQPMGGAEGQASDIEIQAKEILRKKKLLVELFAKNTGQSQKQIEKDNDRDNIMTPEEAKEYGLIDEVIARELIVK